MRKWICCGCVAFALMLGARAARAGPIWAMDLEFSLGSLGSMSFSVSAGGHGYSYGSGTTATWHVYASQLVLGASTFAGTGAPLTQVQVVLSAQQAGSGNLAATPGGVMAISGVMNLKSYGGITLLAVPLVFGVETTLPPVSGYGLSVHGSANGWTTKSTVIQLTTPTPSGATTARMTGTNTLVAGNWSAVTLVTALNLATSFEGQIPAFAALTLHVPEPGTLLLLGAGAAAFAAVGRMKQRG